MEKVMSSLPPDLQTAIHGKDATLGELEAIFPMAPWLRIVGWSLAILFLVMAIALPILMAVDTRPGQEVGKAICGVIAAILGLGGLAFVWWLRSSRGYHLVVFRDALVEVHPPKITLLRWSELNEVWIEPIAIGRKVKVTSTAGATVSFDIGISRPEELVAIVEKRMVDTLLPKAEAVIKTGKNVAFGPLALCEEGLRNGEYLLSWAELSEFSIGYNPGVRRWQLILGQKGKMIKWFVGSTHNIPNLGLFTELVRRARPDLIK
jgi:hypothetical protein